MKISARRITWLGLLVLPMVCLVGCTIHPAAETILTIRLEDPNAATGLASKEIVLGLPDVMWRGERDNYEVVGHGNHPRAHEWYILFEAEGEVLLADRFIRLEPDGPAAEWPDYRIELAVDMRCLSDDADAESRMLVFSGTLPPPHGAFPDNLRFVLNQVPMTSPTGSIRMIYVSGEIIAKPASGAEFNKLVKVYDLRLSYRR